MKKRFKHLSDIREAEWHYLVNTLPYKEVLDILETEFGKLERRHLERYMQGQTMIMIGGESGEAGIYVSDLDRFIKYRKQNLSGKNMPLDD